MNVLAELIAAVIVAFLFTMIFAALKNRGPWGNVWLFFLVVLLAAWIGGIWINPIGPSIFHISILPFIITGALAALILAAAAVSPPPTQTRNKERTADEDDGEYKEEETGSAIGFVFWILIVLMILAIIAGYYWVIPGVEEDVIEPAGLLKPVMGFFA